MERTDWSVEAGALAAREYVETEGVHLEVKGVDSEAWSSPPQS